VDNNEELSTHVAEWHDQTYTVYYVCYVCGLSSDTKEAAKVHLVTHTEKDVEACLKTKGLRKLVSTGMVGHVWCIVVPMYGCHIDMDQCGEFYPITGPD
jgi:hypothetical protein